MYKKLFNHVKKIIPKVSGTEIIALKSGGVSIDREIFKGRVNYNNLYKNVNKITINTEFKVNEDVDSPIKFSGAIL
jgi:hypothetical protein